MDVGVKLVYLMVLGKTSNQTGPITKIHKQVTKVSVLLKYLKNHNIDVRVNGILYVSP
jgi:hypothetical protein